MRVFEVGELFEGRYLIDGTLGVGGFATVYLASDGARAVALKVMSPTDATGIARFEREVKAVTRLRDPHTVALFNYGRTDDGLLYTVFEHVPGVDLSELIEARERLEPEVVIHIAEQVLASLSEAHDAGILHRDIKPENIRVFEFQGDPYAVKVLDFGIARLTDSNAPALTRENEILGTPRYMSPEQLTGRELTPASDLYSVGLVMLEMLAGRAALHGGALVDQLDRLRSGHLFSVPSSGSEATTLSAVIARCIEREPEDRFQSARAVASALRAPEHKTRPLPARENTVRADHKTRWWLFAAAALVVAAGAFVLAPRATEPPPPRRLPTALIAAPTTPPKPTPIESPDAAIEDMSAPLAEQPTVDGTGCGQSREVGRQPYNTFVGEWMVYVPRSYEPNTSHPVVVTLTATGLEPEIFFEQTGLGPIADREQFVVVAPTWESSRDAQKVSRIVERVRADYCIDAARVFVVGFIGGGNRAEDLSCEPWVAASVTASARSERERLPCDNPKPFMLLSPMKTRHALPEGGRNCHGSPKISLAAHEQQWLGRNRCSGKRETYFKYLNSVCSTWKCDEPFVSCWLDGGHNWPGAPPRLHDITRQCDGPQTDFPAGRVVWEFFDSIAAE